MGFRLLQETIDTTSPGGWLVFHVFAALAEFERDLIRERRPGSRQCEPLDERDGLGRGAARTGVRPRMRVEASDAPFAVELVPALQGAQADPAVSGESGEGYLVFDVKSENPPPLDAAHGIRYMAELSRPARARWWR